MRILAIDPSLAKIGIAIVKDGQYERSYTFSTNADDPLDKRLKEIGDHFRNIDEPFDKVIIEQPDVFARKGRYNIKNLASIMLLMTALGTIVGSLQDRYEVFLFLVSEWKGGCNKKTTQLEALAVAGKKLNTHESDAVMMAITFEQRGKFVMERREVKKSGDFHLRAGTGRSFMKRRYTKKTK